MPGAFLYADVVGGAALSSPCVPPAGMPLSNLTDPQPRMRARLPMPWSSSAEGAGAWDISTGLALGFADLWPVSTNLQLYSTAIVPGGGQYSIGSNTTDLGAQSGFNAYTTARRVGSTAAAGANHFLANVARVTVLPNTVYTLSAYIRKASGGSATGNAIVTDEWDAVGWNIRRSAGSMAALGMGGTWQRVTLTFTTLPDTQSLQVYWIADAWTGAEYDLDAPQIEKRATATPPIETFGTPVTRAASGQWVPLRVDFGISRAVDCVALISSTLTAAAVVRVRLSTVDSTGAAGDAWDTGVISAGTNADAAGNVVVLRSTPATGRFLLVEVYDTGAGSFNAFIDLGRLVAGQLWRLTRSHAYGIEEGRMMLDRRDRNALTGAEFPAPAVANPRAARFTLPMLTAAEVLSDHRTLVAYLGAAGDALWIPSTSLAQAELAARCLWGAAATAGEVAAAALHHRGLYSRSFSLVERL